MRYLLIGVLWVGALSGATGCKSETVPVGGECSSRDDCKDRNDCLKLESGKGVCTKSCTMPSSISSDDCPPPTKCTMISMTVTVPGKDVQIPKIPRCMPAGTQ